MTLEEAAAACGVPAGDVRRAAAIKRVSPAVFAQIRDGAVTLSDAERLVARRSIWDQWGREAAQASVAVLGGSSGAAAHLLSARAVHEPALRKKFAYPLEAVRWTAQRLAGIDPELAVDEAVDHLIRGYCAGLAEMAKPDKGEGE